MLLGYMYHYSKNIWLNIGFHLINNGVAITMMYIAVQNGKTMQQAIDGSDIKGNLSNQVVLITGSILLAGIYFLMRVFKKESIRVLANHPAANVLPNNEAAGNEGTNIL
jgi:hypothetical protein